jgi:hypothetical protein
MDVGVREYTSHLSVVDRLVAQHEVAQALAAQR